MWNRNPSKNIAVKVAAIRETIYEDKVKIRVNQRIFLPHTTLGIFFYTGSRKKFPPVIFAQFFRSLLLQHNGIFTNQIRNIFRTYFYRSF